MACYEEINVIVGSQLFRMIRSTNSELSNISLATSLSKIPSYDNETVADSKSSKNQYRRDLLSCQSHFFAKKIDDNRLPTALLVNEAEEMIGLPFLVVDSDLTIIATDACVRLARICMEELLQMHKEQTQLYGPSPTMANVSSLLDHVPSLKPSAVESDGAIPWKGKLLYSHLEMEECLQKVRRVNYREVCSLPCGTQLTAVSSGTGLGSCYWLVNGHTLVLPSLLVKSQLLSACWSAPDQQALAASKATVVPETDKAGGLKLQASSGSVAPGVPFLYRDILCSSHRSLVSKAAESVVSWLAHCQGQARPGARGGCGKVLLPVDAGSHGLELVEEVVTLMDEQQMSHIPVLYISPVAHKLLTLVAALPEWLSKQKQNRFFSAVPPWSASCFSERTSEGRVLCCPSLGSLAQQGRGNLLGGTVVVFACHSSLRCGPASHLLQRWGDDASCLLLLTTASESVRLWLGPFLPLALPVVHMHCEV